MPAPVINDNCTNCGACQSECPVSAIYEGPVHYHIDADLCTECLNCFSICPVFAITYVV